jgi:putative MATE family efflux protein
VLSGILRGVGDVVTPMIAGIVSGILNMVLDPLMIFGWGPFPELGIAGAAYATIIARGLVFLYLLWYIFSGRHHLKLHIKDAKVHWHLVKKMVKIAIPASIAQIFLALSGSFLFARVNTFGAVASSAYSLGSRIDSLLFLPSMSFSQAIATIVGQNIGADKKHRASKAALIAIIQCGIITFVFSTLLMIFPTAIFDLLFNKAGADVLALARNYVLIVSFGYMFLSVRIVINGVFQGSGASIYLMLMTFASLGLRVGLGYAFSFTPLGVRGLFMGISISFVLSAILMFIVFRKGKWLDVDVIKSKKKKQDD